MSLLKQPPLVPERFCIISVDGGQENPNKLFLGGITSQATEKQLEDFFSQFGVVRDVRIVTDRITAECKGYGFVTFDDKEDIQHLVDRKTIRMAGKKIRIRKAIRRNSSQFDHIHTPKTPTKNTNNENAMVRSQSVNDSASSPILIPSETYLSAETHVSSETYPALETYHGNPVYLPLTPPESPEMIYEFPSVSNASPRQLVVPPPMPDAGLFNQQHNGVFQNGVVSPPLWYPNYPITFIPRVPSPSWFRY